MTNKGMAQRPAPLPDWLLDLFPKQDSTAISTKAMPDGGEILEGERNNRLTSLGGTMRRAGFSLDTITDALLGENQIRCVPPLPEQEVKAIAESISRYPSGTVLTSGNSEFNFTSLADLLDEPAEVVEWCWDETLPTGGFSILTAKPKVGKSTLARNLALAISRGEEFLGRSTTQGPVVYVALEEKRSEVRKHFLKMGASSELILVHCGNSPPNPLPELEGLISDKKPTLVIIDPLWRLLRVGDANNYSEVTRVLEPLMIMARKSGAHIMVVHHGGKNEREGGDTILGSTAIFGAVDTALIMRRKGENRTIESVQRYGQDFPETALEFQPDSGTTTAAGTTQDLQNTTVRAHILEELEAGEKSEEEIRGAIGGNTGVTGRALRDLVDKGVVVRGGAGKRGDPYRYHMPVSSFTTNGENGKRDSELYAAVDELDYLPIDDESTDGSGESLEIDLDFLF